MTTRPTVASQQSRQRGLGGDRGAGSELAADLREVGAEVAAQGGDVDDDVDADGGAPAGRGAGEGFGGHLDQCGGASFREGAGREFGAAGVGSAAGVEGGAEDLAAFGVEFAAEGDAAVERRRQVDVRVLDRVGRFGVGADVVGVEPPGLGGFGEVVDVERRGGVEERVFVVGVEVFAAAGLVGQHLQVVTGQVAGGEGFGGAFVAPHQPGRAHQPVGLPLRDRSVAGEPRGGGAGTVGGPIQLAVPLGGGADQGGLGPLGDPGQPDDPLGAGRAGPVAPVFAGEVVEELEDLVDRIGTRTCVRLYRTERAKATRTAVSAESAQIGRPLDPRLASTEIRF